MCPECGELLYSKLSIDDKTGELIIDIYCDGDSDDEYQLQIFTGLTFEDIEDLEIKEKIFSKKMQIVLKERIPESC